MTDEVRVTQVPLEVLSVDENPTLRATQAPLEVLSVDENPTLRTTQTVLEVLSTTASAVVNALTRHTPHGLPGQPWGDFSGKQLTEAVRTITQLMPHALPGRPYGNFGGKQLSDDPDDLIYNRGFMANMNRSMIPR